MSVGHGCHEGLAETGSGTPVSCDGEWVCLAEDLIP
jgi:hypothetical protein